MKLNFVGDIFISETDGPPFVDKRLKEFLTEGSVTISNLEAPITNHKIKAEKTGPNLKNSTKVIDFLKSINSNCVNLANNHILDYEVKGVEDTISLLKENQIDFIGTSVNSNGYVLKTEQQIIRVISFCENEWVHSSNNNLKISNFEEVKTGLKIKNLKETSDILIVVFHGGIERYDLPTPGMQNLFRSFIEAGADAVINHHSHCVSGIEYYKSKPIFYSLGNFYFDSSIESEKWYRGMIVTLEIENKKISSSYNFIHQEAGRIDLVNETEKIKEEKRIERLNESILDEKNLRQHWENYLSKRLETIVCYLLFGDNLIYRVLKKLGVLHLFVSKKRCNYLINLIRSDFHRETSLKSLILYKKKYFDSRNSS